MTPGASAISALSDQHPSETILSIRDLTVGFRTDSGWSPVLHGISLDVKAGETLALVGESGSGKSVTSMAVMRLLDERNARIEGNIKLGAKDILALSEREMQKVRGNEIAMIFQEPMTSLNPVLTIGRQISEALVKHRGLSSSQAQSETIRLLDRVRIPSASTRVNDYPHNMSGGMRQRVMIAMALTCRPKLLIADEPTTALDVTIQAQILQLIDELRVEQKMAVLFVTHDMGVVAEIADRTAVMFRGNIVETGSTEEIFRQHRHDYTRRLLSAVPRLGAMAGERGPVKFPVYDEVSAEPASFSRPDVIPDAAAPVLDVRNLVTRFDIRKGLFGRVNSRVHAVENVSFSIRPGETLSLVGESGCGKSTTGRSILRLVTPTAGTVLLDSEDISHLDAASLRSKRRSMQMVFQDPFASLNPRMRVGEAIAEPLIIHHAASRPQAHEKAASLMDLVGLNASMMSRFPHEFSGGQRQRICIARALALDPRLIVADECVSALDVSVKAQIVNLLLDLQERLKLALLFISHDMAIVERMSHRVAVMYMGEIVEIGSRAEVLGNPAHPYTRRLLEAVPIPDPAVRGRHHSVPIGSEPRTPLRSTDWVAPERRWRQLDGDHQVMEWGEEW